MNILLINHYAGSPKYGMEYRPYYLAKEWVKLGHKVRVVASSESHLHQIKPTINSTATLEKIDKIDYIWLKSFSYKGNGLGRILNMLSFLRRLFSERKTILKNFNPDIVIASSPHPFIFRGAKKISKEANAKLIYEVRDIWPLSLIELLGMSPKHPLVALMQYEENYAYRKSDMVASLLPKAIDHMSKHGLVKNKFIYTPNGIVVDEWNISTPLSFDKIDKFRNDYNFLIGYAGTHGKPNALSFLLNAANEIRKQKIGIVLIGNGPEKAKLISQAKEMNIKNILFLETIKKELVPSFLMQMDALYIGWEHQPLYRFGISANKLFEYMMSGKPIIHSVEAGNDPILESCSGISCPPEDPKLIAKAIISLSKLTPNELKEKGNRGKNYVIKNHNYAVLAKKYLDELA